MMSYPGPVLPPLLIRESVLSIKEVRLNKRELKLTGCLVLRNNNKKKNNRKLFNKKVKKWDIVEVN